MTSEPDRRPDDPDEIPDDGRRHQPGVHPAVERSGRSRRTAVALAIALVAAIALYLAIVSGITLPGAGG